MKPVFFISIVFAILAGGVLQSVGARMDPVPVRVGGEPNLDACATTGIVTGLKPTPGNYLAVRDGPGPAFERIHKLQLGDRVWLCDSAKGWVGVVHGEDCGVATPIPVRKPYAGPCVSGWVSERFIALEAG
jgi:hypothetical protein